MNAFVEGKNLNVDELLREQPQRSQLAIYTVRKSELDKLNGLNRLPLTSLELRWLSSADLTPVQFPSELQNLMVWHSSKLRSLEGISAAPNLMNLVLEDNGPLENTTQLSVLKNLRTLSITGGFTSIQKIASLDAIEGLPIEKLTLRAVAGANLDLSPIARLPNIRELDIHGPNFAPEELAKVAAAHPWFHEQLLDLDDYAMPGMRCKKCGGIQKEMFLRRKKFLWCPSCNQSGIDRVLDRFNELVRLAKT